MKVSACASLISYLPKLESVSLGLCPIRDDLGCLLEALAWCPCLRALDLFVEKENGEGDYDLHWPFAYESAFAKLSRLTKLLLQLDDEVPCTLANVMAALVPLTGLVGLDLCLGRSAVLPAGLGHFKHLQTLALRGFSPFVLEAGCLDLPHLRSLEFRGCNFVEDAEELPGVAALQRLTRIEISGGMGWRFFDPHLVQLPGLQRLVLSCDIPDDDDEYGIANSAPARPLRLPGNMGLLRSSLLHLDIRGLRLAQFPLTLTQLVALENLDVRESDFAELPAGITALSRLTQLSLGRVDGPDNPLQLNEKRPLNAVALGDLSSFPVLCKLTFSFCEVKLCMSLLGGAVRHATLARIFLHFAHPAPESVPMMLQLSQDLRRRGVLKVTDRGFNGLCDYPAQALPPFYKFKAALEWCAL